MIWQLFKKYNTYSNISILDKKKKQKEKLIRSISMMDLPQDGAVEFA